MTRSKLMAFCGSIIYSLYFVLALYLDLTAFSAPLNLFRVLGAFLGFFMGLGILTFCWLAAAKIDKSNARGWKIFLLVIGILLILTGLLMVLLSGLALLMLIGAGTFFILAFSLGNKPVKPKTARLATLLTGGIGLCSILVLFAFLLVASHQKQSAKIPLLASSPPPTSVPNTQFSLTTQVFTFETFKPFTIMNSDSSEGGTTEADIVQTLGQPSNISMIKSQTDEKTTEMVSYLNKGQQTVVFDLEKGTDGRWRLRSISATLAITSEKSYLASDIPAMKQIKAPDEFIKKYGQPKFINISYGMMEFSYDVKNSKQTIFVNWYDDTKGVSSINSNWKMNGVDISPE